MKSSWKKALVLLLVFALIVSGSLYFAHSRKRRCSHPFPMWLEVFDETGLESPEHIKLKYDRCSFDPSSTEEEQVALQIECTSTEQTRRWQNHFRILYRKDKDSKWHIIFSKGHAVQAVNAVEPSGTNTLSCLVPRRLFSHRGAYKIVIPDRGSCDLPRGKLWTGPDEECGQMDGIHSESGFPMHFEFGLAGSLHEDPDRELITAELIKGKETDTLKLTVNVQGTIYRDYGVYQVLFCPPKGDRQYIVYSPAEFLFYDFYEPANYRIEIVPGLNTVEYPVPKGLFQQKGDYYISCGVGEYRLFKD